MSQKSNIKKQDLTASSEPTDIGVVLKDRGLKVTPARLAVGKEVLGMREPFSVEMIFNHVAKKLDIDLVTVYRTIALFEKMQIIKKVLLPGKVDWFESSLHHHHHIVCKNCGIVKDIDVCHFKHISPTVLHQSGFATVSDHVFELFGVCKSCIK